MGTEPTPATHMTSSEFVSSAVYASREARSWDDASNAFPGRARWDVPADSEVCASSAPDSEAVES
jgi:hypothetical protein